MGKFDETYKIIIEDLNSINSISRHISHKNHSIKSIYHVNNIINEDINDLILPLISLIEKFKEKLSNIECSSVLEKIIKKCVDNLDLLTEKLNFLISNHDKITDSIRNGLNKLSIKLEKLLKDEDFKSAVLASLLAVTISVVKLFDRVGRKNNNIFLSIDNCDFYIVLLYTVDTKEIEPDHEKVLLNIADREFAKFNGHRKKSEIGYDLIYYLGNENIEPGKLKISGRRRSKMGSRY
jgi:hypothetical protein